MKRDGVVRKFSPVLTDSSTEVLAGLGGWDCERCSAPHPKLNQFDMFRGLLVSVYICLDR